MEVEIASFIHDMKNLRQSISQSDNSFVDVPPARENESNKMLAIFYRTASDSTVLKVQPVALSAGERSCLWLLGGAEMLILEAAMWTPEDRALVGDFGSGQALSDDQYRLIEPFIPPPKPRRSAPDDPYGG